VSGKLFDDLIAASDDMPLRRRNLRRRRSNHIPYSCADTLTELDLLQVPATMIRTYENIKPTDLLLKNPAHRTCPYLSVASAV
jgi:hypothetical protein